MEWGRRGADRKGQSADLSPTPSAPDFSPSYDTCLVEPRDASPAAHVMRSGVWLWSARNQRSAEDSEPSPDH